MKYKIRLFNISNLKCSEVDNLKALLMQDNIHNSVYIKTFKGKIWLVCDIEVKQIRIKEVEK